MSTFKSTNYRAFLLVPVFAAFAVHAQAAQAADGPGDTQGQVRSVLEGTRSVTSAYSRGASHTAAQVADLQDNARQVLLGIHTSNADANVVGAVSSKPSSLGAAAGGKGYAEDLQKQTQRVVLGRVAS